MKKLLGVAAFAILGVVALSSCKKEFTCTCSGTSSLTTYDKTGKGKDADAACTDAADKVLGIPIEVCVPK
jgi:hypothetical protein